MGMLANPAADLAVQINAEHRLAVERATDALSHARVTGDLLLLAQQNVPHGQWITWLAEHCPDISARRAQKYMQLARTLAGPDAPRVAHLSQRAALAELATPRPVPCSPVIDTDEIIAAGEATGCDHIPPELCIAVESGHITYALINGVLAIHIEESARHPGFWYCHDRRDNTVWTRPILGRAVGLAVRQIAGWERAEWHMAPADGACIAEAA
jgi:hypothetical protein